MKSVDLSYINNDSNSINYYIVESLWNTQTGYVTGTAIDIPSNSLVIRRDRVETSTSPHEVGHCLNLFHTFQGTATGTSGCSEAIDGSNCSTCGDKVCDTPADANTGNSNGYSPDLTNIMSYYSNRDHFTDEQSSRMIASIMSIPILEQLVSNSCSNPEITGPDLICSGSSYTFTLQNPPTSVNWNYGPEVTLISQTNTSITVQAANVYARGESFVEINGGAARKDFYVGMPDANLPQAPIICTNQFSFEPYELPVSNGAESYRIVSSSPNLTIDGMSEMTYQDAPVLFNFLSTSAGTYLVELFTTNACGESRAAMYVTSERCGGPGGPGGFNISPNPASNVINIKSNTDKTNTTTNTQGSVFKKKPPIAKLFDFNGAFVKEIELDAYGTTKMDVSSLKEGFYFLKIQVRGEEETYKIIVKH